MDMSQPRMICWRLPEQTHRAQEPGTLREGRLGLRLAIPLERAVFRIEKPASCDFYKSRHLRWRLTSGLYHADLNALPY